MNTQSNQQEIFKTRFCTVFSFVCITSLFIALYSQLIGLPIQESTEKTLKEKHALMQVVHSTP